MDPIANPSEGQRVSLVTVPPKPKRAHQGWRYLEDQDAPSVDDGGTGLASLPPKLYGRLAELALV